MRKEKIFHLNLYFGLFILIFSACFLVLKVPFIKSWFYSFAWWSLILIVDSLNFKRMKRSPLSDSPRHFVFMAFISVFVWLIFELFNLRLKNWSYHGLPYSLWERWLGFFIAFATVIPGMKEIAFFIRSLFKEKKIYLFKIRVSSVFLRLCIALGGISVFLALSWPRKFFPLVWLCFIFLLEPVNYWLKNRTFLRDVEEGEWSNILSWILAGFVAGFFWEFWNYWAGSRWQYTLPYLNQWRVFQMPLLGYTGFLPFALEIFAIYQFLFWMYKKLEKRIFIKISVIILLLFLYGSVFYLIDIFTLVR